MTTPVKISASTQVSSENSIFETTTDLSLGNDFGTLLLDIMPPSANDAQSGALNDLNLINNDEINQEIEVALVSGPLKNQPGEFNSGNQIQKIDGSSSLLFHEVPEVRQSGFLLNSPVNNSALIAIVSLQASESNFAAKSEIQEKIGLSSGIHIESNTQDSFILTGGIKESTELDVLPVLKLSHSETLGSSMHNQLNLDAKVLTQGEIKISDQLIDGKELSLQPIKTENLSIVHKIDDSTEGVGGSFAKENAEEAASSEKTFFDENGMEIASLAVMPNLNCSDKTGNDVLLSCNNNDISLIGRKEISSTDVLVPFVDKQKEVMLASDSANGDSNRSSVASLEAQSVNMVIRLGDNSLGQMRVDEVQVKAEEMGAELKPALMQHLKYLEDNRPASVSVNLKIGDYSMNMSMKLTQTGHLQVNFGTEALSLKSILLDTWKNVAATIHEKGWILDGPHFEGVASNSTLVSQNKITLPQTGRTPQNEALMVAVHASPVARSAGIKPSANIRVNALLEALSTQIA